MFPSLAWQAGEGGDQEEFKELQGTRSASNSRDFPTPESFHIQHPALVQPFLHPSPPRRGSLSQGSICSGCTETPTLHLQQLCQEGLSYVPCSHTDQP